MQYMRPQEYNLAGAEESKLGGDSSRMIIPQPRSGSGRGIQKLDPLDFKQPKRNSKLGTNLIDSEFSQLDKILTNAPIKSDLNIFNRGNNLKGGLINPDALIKKVFD